MLNFYSHLFLCLHLFSFFSSTSSLIFTTTSFLYLHSFKVRQAELEQNNVELSIGITERQREITRLKIQQEQVRMQNILYLCTLVYRM